MGRRRDDQAELRDEALEALSEGKTLREWCKENGVAYGTAYGWMVEEPAVEARYRKAVKAGAAAMAEEALHVARRAGPGSANSDRLLIDQLRWLAAKADPARYGDRQVVEHQGGQEVRVKVIEEVAPVQVLARVSETPAMLPSAAVVE